MKMSVKKLIASLVMAAAAITAARALNIQATGLSTKGKTEVMKGTSWTPLKIGSIIEKGDVIQTGFKSELILKIKNTTVTVSPLSRITIEQLASKGNKDETRLFLDTGSLKSDVKKTEDRRVGFTVRSPVATASVRGTIFGVTNGFGNTTTVAGYDGVTASSKNKTIAKPEIAAEGSDEDKPAVEGSDAAAISDGELGAGSTLNRKGQKTVFKKNSIITPKDNAKSDSSNIGGIPAVLNEAEVTKKSSASINVTVKIEDLTDQQ